MPRTHTLRGTVTGSQHRDLMRPDASDNPSRSVEAARPQVGKKAGRPRGSKNKPKGIITSEVTEKMLPVLQKQLSPESYEYVKGVLKQGRPIETKRELDVMIAMLARNLIAALADETMNLDAGFRKDLTERLKVINSMLTLRHQIEKNSDDGSKPGESVLVKVIGDRKLLDNGRLGVLVGVQPGGVAGTVDGTGRTPDRVGAVSDQLPERPLLSTSGEQE